MKKIPIGAIFKGSDKHYDGIITLKKRYVANEIVYEKWQWKITDHNNYLIKSGISNSYNAARQSIPLVRVKMERIK